METCKRTFQTVWPAFKGTLELWIEDAWGNLLEYVRQSNLVVNTGKAIAAHEIGDTVNRVGVGTNGAPATPGDVAPLTEQYAKAFASVEYPDQRSVRFNFVITTDEYVGKTIREFGLLVEAGGAYTLFARRGGFEIPKTNQVQVQGVWTIQF